MSALQQSHWTNVHANSPKDGFWKHEWEKHGTCAMQLPQMDSELKFFEEGVALNGRFPLQKYLSDADITPGTQTGLLTQNILIHNLR